MATATPGRLLDEDDLARLVREQARPGDMVVCLGAGTISAWANALPQRLGALSGWRSPENPRLWKKSSPAAQSV